MFTRDHFIWLAIVVLINIVMLTINRRKKLSLKDNLTVMTVVLFLSESTKILTTIKYYEEFGGYYLDPKSLPFHLCSIQIFFFLYLRFFCKNEEVKEKLLSFMYPTLLLGGFGALLVPVDGVSFLSIKSYQCFIYHGFIVYFAFYLVREKVITIDFKSIKRNIAYMFALMVFDLWINSALCAYGTNFMFLSVAPMENLPFLNTNHGWIVYISHFAIVSIIMMIAVQLPFALKKQRQLSNLSSNN